jgi:hypothetical protein
MRYAISSRIPFALALPLLVGLASPPSAGADESGRLTLFGHHYSVIAGASVFVPDETTTRSIYGHRSFAPVLALWNFRSPRGLGLAWDLGAQRLSDLDREASVIRGGVGPRILFAPASADLAPYLAVRGDAYVTRLDQGSWRAEPGANVELGASVLRHVVVSTRYDAVRKIDGVSLSGFSGRVAVKVF